MTPDTPPAQPLSQDQILAQLMTRGFEEGFQRTPLRDFWGKLSSITGEMRTGNTGSYAIALYNFDDVDPIEATEPYTSPIGQLEVPVSTRARSKMGYLGKSIDNIINAGLPLDAPPSQVKNQSYIIGKTLHMKLTPGHSIPSRDDATGLWTDKPTDCWVLLEIRGEGVVVPIPAVGTPVSASVVPAGVGAYAQALSLLNGKTEQQWHQLVFADPVVKADAKVIMDIINRSFLAGLEAAGKIVKEENGNYRVIA